LGEIVNLADARAVAYKRDFIQSNEFHLIKSLLTPKELEEFLFFITEFAEVLAEIEDYKARYLRAKDEGNKETINKTGIWVESTLLLLDKLLEHYREFANKVGLNVNE